MFFLLGKKEPKTQSASWRTTSFFYRTMLRQAQQRSAFPPKKMQFALFRQYPPHNYQHMINGMLNDKIFF